MRNLLFYLDYRSRSGAQRVMVELANYFADNGDNVTLACQFQSPEEGYDLSEKVEEVILPKPSKNKLKRQSDRIKALSELCIEKKPDVIISFLIVTNIIAIKVGKKLGIPVLISVRNDPERDGNFFKKLAIKACYPKASACVFQTEDAKNYFGFSYPTRVIMNPLSSEIIKSVDSIPASIEDKNTYEFVSLGRLEPQKRHDLEIKAFSKVAKEYPKARLSIYGKGPLEEELNRLISELGLQEVVKLAGVTSEVPSVLGKSDAFIMSSDYEGMPNALMEAMAMGLPCIVTDCPCGGPRALINTGENGVLIPVGDEAALADKMIEMLLNPEHAKAMGEKAAQIKDKCSIKTIAPMWAEIIDICRETHY